MNSQSKLWTAIRAGLPLIAVTTDDIANFEADLMAVCAPQPVQLAVPNTSLHSAAVSSKLALAARKVYWSDAPAMCSPTALEKFDEAGATLVLVNLNDHPNHHLAFNAGQVPFNTARFWASLEGVLIHADFKPEILAAVGGLSVLEASRVVRLTGPRHGQVNPANVKETRGWLHGAQKGLVAINTAMPVYLPPPQLEEWVQLNASYFTDPKAPGVLVPRGLLLDGPPGTGKTSAAKYIAACMGVSLYRLDLAATLDKFIGVSEQRLADILTQVDRQSPCVLLIDEAEKVFTTGENESVPARLMGQLLWWLQERTSRVVVIMTTNNRKKIPPELYREGRLDGVLELTPLTGNANNELALQVLKAILPAATGEQRKMVISAVQEAHGENFGHAPQAAITATVIRTIKAKKWL